MNKQTIVITAIVVFIGGFGLSYLIFGLSTPTPISTPTPTLLIPTPTSYYNADVQTKEGFIVYWSGWYEDMRKNITSCNEKFDKNFPTPPKLSNAEFGERWDYWIKLKRPQQTKLVEKWSLLDIQNAERECKDLERINNL